MIRVVIEDTSEDGSTRPLATAVFRNDERAGPDADMQTYDFQMSTVPTYGTPGRGGFKSASGRVAHDRNDSVWNLVFAAFDRVKEKL